MCVCFNGAAREIAQFVCFPGMNKALGSVFSTAYSGVLVQTLFTAFWRQRWEDQKYRSFWAIESPQGQSGLHEICWEHNIKQNMKTPDRPPHLPNSDDLAYW